MQEVSIFIFPFDVKTHPNLKCGGLVRFTRYQMMPFLMLAPGMGIKTNPKIRPKVKTRCF